MNLSQLKTDQLEAYLASLTPKAAAFLVREVERDRLRGGNAFPHDFILAHARRLLQSADEDIWRPATPLRVFCLPFEDLLCDHSTETKQQGRIRRASIDPIWKWLKYSVAAEVVGRLETEYDSCAADIDDNTIAERNVQTYRQLSVAISSALEGIEPATKPYFKLANQLGGDVVLEDAREMAACFAVAPVLLNLRARLPLQVREILPDDLPLYADICKNLAANSPDQGYLLGLTIYRRVTHVSDAIRVVREIVGSDRADIIQSHPMGVVGAVVLHDLETAGNLAANAIRSRHSHNEVIVHLSSFNTLSSGMSDALDIERTSEWGRRVADTRTKLSEVIKEEIAAIPRIVKAALYPKRGSGSGTRQDAFSVPPDAVDVAEAAFLVQLLVDLRLYLDQLAINAVYTGIKAEVEQYVEAIGERLLRELSNDAKSSARNVFKYLEAAGSMVTMLFGAETSSLLIRRGRSAMKSGVSPEEAQEA